MLVKNLHKLKALRHYDTVNISVATVTSPLLFWFSTFEIHQVLDAQEMSAQPDLIEKTLTEPLECEPTSNFRSLSVSTLSESSVNLQWNYVRPERLSTLSQELVFKLMKLEARDGWKSIAWTRKMFCVVKNLEQNVCYSLKLLVLVEEENEFVNVDETDVFKASILIN